MAISPNDNFTAGQVLTATECNQFPRGVMALATSTTNYTLTTSTVIATGMTITFAADSTRMYKITYYEPYVETSTAGSGSTTTGKERGHSGPEVCCTPMLCSACLSLK